MRMSQEGPPRPCVASVSPRIARLKSIVYVRGNLTLDAACVAHYCVGLIHKACT
jgi:hypothetical protein